MTRRIERQVKLPVRVALQVVLQGIRIRFGRSLVTVSGVALGVAFLMSILTGQIIQHGVRDEEAVRNELGRMYGLLTVEVGPVAGRAIGVVQTGPLNKLERRLAGKLLDEDAGAIRWATLEGVKSTAPDAPSVQAVTVADIGADVVGVIVMGPLPSESRWRSALEAGVVTATRRDVAAAAGGASAVVSLEKQLSEEEVLEAAEVERRRKFRSVWIITISMLVTVIGIANAMLMSVTERFREIGTMKCLGALSSFIRRIFLIESSLIGIVGSVAGAVFGAVFSVGIYSISYGPAMVFGSMDWLRLLVYLAGSIAAGLALAVIAAIYPASFASRMVPADALRSSI